MFKHGLVWTNFPDPNHSVSGSKGDDPGVDDVGGQARDPAGKVGQVVVQAVLGQVVADKATIVATGDNIIIEGTNTEKVPVMFDVDVLKVIPGAVGFDHSVVFFRQTVQFPLTKLSLGSWE